MSLDHPFYSLFSDPGIPKFKGDYYKIKRSYFKTGKIEETEIWSDGSKHKFIVYRKKISDIYNSLVEAKFFVKKIIEPLSLKEKEWEKSVTLKNLLN